MSKRELWGSEPTTHPGGDRMGTNAVSERNQSWVDFAGVMLLISGIFNIIYGAATLGSSDYFVNKILYWNMEGWGWSIMIVGVILVSTAWFIFQNNVYAEVFGVIVAVASAFLHASTLQFSPIWSLIVLIISILIIYGLVVHGDIRGRWGQPAS